MEKQNSTFSEGRAKNGDIHLDQFHNLCGPNDGLKMTK